MLYIFSNSDDKSIHHIVCTDSDIRAGVIISRIYEREHISGEPIRVQFHNETALKASIVGVAKRYEAIKATDKSNDTFEEEIRAKVAELGKGEPAVNSQYNEFINDIIASYRNDKRIITLKDFVYNCIDLKGYNAEKVYNDVNAEVDKRITKGYKEELKAKVDALATSNNDVNKASSYSARIDELAGAYYRHKLNNGMINIIKEVARNNNYDVDKFVKDVSRAHKDAHSAYMHALKKQIK